jgi:predicted N-formylglutamate amidohydrolase
VRWALLVSCEHASPEVPAGLELGVPADVLRSHTGWDEGAQTVAALVARTFGAPAHYGAYTRLIADLNRSPTNPEVVPAIAFGTPVPGNQGLSAAERQDRIERYHQPYWRAVLAELCQLFLADPERVVLHLSVHSFTPELNGQVRPMPVGVLYDPAQPLEELVARTLIGAYQKAGLTLAENRPYDGRADALTTACRGFFRAERYAGVEIELNQGRLHELDRLSQPLLQGLAQLLGQRDG